MGPTGIGVEYSSEPARGSTALAASMAMSTTATIRISVTTVRSQSAATGHSNTSAAMRRETDEATRAIQATMRAMNVIFPDIVAADTATTTDMAMTTVDTTRTVDSRQLRTKPLY